MDEVPALWKVYNLMGGGIAYQCQKVGLVTFFPACFFVHLFAVFFPCVCF